MTDFWKTLRQLWQKERLTTRQRFEDARKSGSVKIRVARGLALTDVEIDETAAATGDRTLLWLHVAPDQLELFRGGPGTPVRLWTDQPDGEFIGGVVARRRGKRLGVMVDVFPPDRFFDGVFQVDAEAPETTFDRGDKAIRVFETARANDRLGPLCAALLGQNPPTYEKNAWAWQATDGSLHARQLEAIQRALDAREIALIHGPPGTGKTRTLVEYIRQEVGRGNRVLVTAASNVAVDTITERLVGSGLDPVRLGHPARVLESVETFTLDARLEARPDFKLVRQWQDEAGRLFRKLRSGAVPRAERRTVLAEAKSLNGDARRHLRGVQDAILSQASVICATASGADMALIRDLEFDVCVLDEATQTPDPIALVAAQRAPKLVLAGDPRQLPPTVIDLEAEAAGLGKTFFERLESHAVMLDTQHRMHRAIMRFPSEQFYHGALVAAPEVATHTLGDLGVADDPLRDGPLVFVDTAGKGFDELLSPDDPSTANPGQAERTANEVRRLLSRGLHAKDIAVITPYDAQVRLLKKWLPIDGLEIGTVDGFQGREKEAVIIDLVRSNEQGEIGFVGDVRRLNVAMTRARRFLLLVGDTATLGRRPIFAALFDHIEQHELWLSAWSDEAEPL